MQPSDFLNNLCILKLTSILHCPMEKECYPIKNNRRIAHGFMCTFSGTETYHFKDRIIRAEPGSVLFLPKDEPYTITFEGEKSDAYVINFELSTPFPRPFIINFPQSNRIKDLFVDAERKWKNKKAGYNPECLSLFYNLVSVMFKQEKQYLNTDSLQKIAPAIEHLKLNFNNPDLRIEQLAEMSGMSIKYFESLFYKKYAATPKEYILFLKIERAKDLLQDNKIKISEIPYSLGYSDIYHFSKIFKSKTGYTPREYRKLLK